MNDFEPIQFSGRITASLTHELRNVLAVIRETGGLMQDILFMDPRMAEHPRADRIQQGFRTLMDQVGRGSQLIERLNRFAHAADTPRQHFDLCAATRDFFELSDRFCRLRQITLEPQTDPMEIPVCASRFDFLSALFKAMDLCLRLPEGTRIPVTFSAPRDVCFHIPENPAMPDTAPEGSGGFQILTAPGEIRVRLDETP